MKWLHDTNPFKKFIWIDLSKVAVQEERGPRRPKTSMNSSIIGAKKRILSAPASNPTKPNNTFAPSVTCNYNILAQILIACVKQAKINESFSILSLQQQRVILKTVWTECFVLRVSHWPIDTLPIITEQLVYQNKKII